MDEKINDLVNRGIVNVIPDKEKLVERLNVGEKLNVYLGIDPTATRIHLGHAVCLRKLKLFADLGHHVTFLIGDFTALIGDTSDKDTERPRLTPEEIRNNFETYKEQASKVLDFDKVEVRFNSEWLKPLRFEDIVKLCQHFSVGDFVGRELIQKRLEDGKPVGLHETLYPVMQGYDSFHLDTDVQIGAADQTFNMQAGRMLMKDISDKDSFVLVTDYLTGTDGRKMSKSWGNAIWLSDEPSDMFGKVMSLRDDLIIQYFTLATRVPNSDIEKYKNELESGKNPIEIKLSLAEQIVSELHGEEAAKDAKAHFEKTFQDKVPEYQQVEISAHTLAAAVSEVSSISTSEAKRLIKQNAVDVNDETITDPAFELKKGDKIKVGKRGFFEIKLLAYG